MIHVLIVEKGDNIRNVVYKRIALNANVPWRIVPRH
jgi:hypothetical protein